MAGGVQRNQFATAVNAVDMAAFTVQRNAGRVFTHVAQRGNFFPLGGIDDPQHAFLRRAGNIKALIFLIEQQFARRDKLIVFHAFIELNSSEFFTGLGIDHRD
ncbi:hypothetical protein D3C72_1340390 [compost metagenome]